MEPKTTQYPSKEVVMEPKSKRLKKAKRFDAIGEARYLTHCNNLAMIIASGASIKKYIQVTGAETDGN